MKCGILVFNIFVLYFYEIEAANNSVAHSNLEVSRIINHVPSLPQNYTRGHSHKRSASVPWGNCNNTEDDETSCGTVEYLGCTGSKKFYHESAIKMTWFEGWEYCRSIGLHMASIESRYEQTFIEIFLPKLETANTETYWTSGTDLGKEGKYTWMSNGREFTFSNFRPGEPNNRFGSEDCIELLIVPGISGYGWNDRNCLVKGYVLCQHDMRYPEKLLSNSGSSETHL